MQLGAWIDTAPVDAGQTGRALGVDATFVDLSDSNSIVLFRTTFHQRIASCSRRTATHRRVVLGTAFGTRPTNGDIAGTAAASVAINAGHSRRIVHTRIHALRIGAPLITRAVSIRAAANNRAALPRIPAIATLAATLRLVVGHIAFGIVSARIAQQARTDAVPIHTSPPGITLGIDATAQRPASGVRIAFVAVATRAHRPMVLHATLGVQTAIARIATLAIDARLLVGAFAVQLATGWRQIEHSLTAFAVGAGHPQLGALAHHRADWRRIDDTAFGGASARREFGARIDAAISHARQPAGALGVDGALGAFDGPGWRTLVAGDDDRSPWRLAVRQRIAVRQLFGTHANGGVRTHIADGVLGARRVAVGGARIDAALLLGARPIAGAIGIAATFGAHAMLERVTDQAGRAAACGPVVVRVAFGGEGARIIEGARIVALAVVVASLVVGTVVVGGATDRIAADQSVAGEAGFAEADRMVVVDEAVGVAAAAAGADAALVDARFGQGAFGVGATADGWFVGGCGGRWSRN